MKQSSLLNNPAFRFTAGAIGTWIVITISLFLALVAYNNKASASAKPAPIPANQFEFVSEFEVMGAHLSPKSSDAMIKLGGFYIPVKFTFDTEPKVEITSLEIGEITDINGHGYNDFTIHQDHKAINAALVAYINKRKVGAI
ncbi:hypothetical protein F900_01905 [Acinetobacter modestus]|uniref:Uncharacterized protein n=1 Tax=Acinetobacter modestus TaxID=1776740 RepID=N9N5K6_9GAMM|nr:hypothetical protein [Acinetobacter modestus]ENX00921.1 hypothetical protein F900_01905 [Acinetobacter modestus]